MSGFTLRGRVVAFLFVALAVCICAPSAVYATASETTTTTENGNDGPVYLVLSLKSGFETPELPDCDCDECECDDCENGEVYYSKSYSECDEGCDCDCDDCDCEEVTGSGTYIIEIGTYVAGYEVGEARFDPLAILEDIDLPGELEFEDLDGYEITIIGAFDTFSPETVHMVTPAPDDEDGVPRKVQEAFFLASPALDGLPEFPESTTVEMAQFIFDFATNPESGDPEYFLGDQSDEGGEGPLDPQAILDNIFVTEAVMECPPGDVACEAEGDLFPHDPDDDEPLFEFAFQIDEDGGLSVDVCLTVEIDIKPLSKHNFVWIDRWFGVLPVILFGSDEFDVDEIEKGTLRLGGVKPYCKVFVKDFNCDGNKDVLAFWRVRSLVKAGALGKKTTELNLTGDLTDGGCIKGTDSVKPKWRKKRKKKCW